MGLAADLGYTHRTGNPVHRTLRALGGSRPGAWMFSKSLRHMDTFIGKVSKGRTSAPELLTGLAVLDLTTTGRKSGQRRTSHLIATPYDGELALLGTNFGQPGTPAWVLNLEADPRGSVTFRNRTREVVARPLTPEETEEVFTIAARFYPGYAHYRHRIGDSRTVRAFLLTGV